MMIIQLLLLLSVLQKLLLTNCDLGRNGSDAGWGLHQNDYHDDRHVSYEDTEMNS